jgi:RPA family protein
MTCEVLRDADGKLNTGNDAGDTVPSISPEEIKQINDEARARYHLEHPTMKEFLEGK